MQGKYMEAARAFSKHGAVDQAMQIFTDLRQYAQAKAWAVESAKSGQNCPAGCDLLSQRPTKCWTWYVFSINLQSLSRYCNLTSALTVIAGSYATRFRVTGWCCGSVVL